MSQQLYGQENESWSQWKDTLEELLINVKDEDYLTRIFNSNLKRTYRFAKVVDLSVSHYVYNWERSMDRMDMYLQAIEVKKSHVLAMEAQV